jgi:hypothetical protein
MINFEKHLLVFGFPEVLRCLQEHLLAALYQIGKVNIPFNRSTPSYCNKAYWELFWYKQRI